MKTKKQYLPKNKEDLKFSIYLYQINDFDVIKDDIPELFEWLQDYNWEQAEIISEYLKRFNIVHFESEIQKVLESKDDIWKFWILKKVVLPSEYTPSDFLLNKIHNIILNPTQGEIEEEVDKIANKIYNKWIC